MKTAIYTALFTLLSITLSFSQTSLKGKVTDANSGEPILFATVALYQSDVLISGVETDLEGNFFFSDITPGTYDVEASYIGYTPEKIKGVQVKAGRVNQLDITISEGISMDAVEIVEYAKPLFEFNRTTAGSVSYGIKSSPSAPPATSITSAYHADGVRVRGVATSFDRSSLPSSGQLTVGEWNDLHNWRDWMTLLEDESYSIMMERFAIHPTDRYSVIVVNQDNAVLANVPVQLLDREGSVIWETFTDNSGKAELWENVFNKDQIASTIKVRSQMKDDIVKIEDGSNTFVLQEDCYSPDMMDIVFVVDATSSMNDEITYLKSELLDVIDRIEETNEDIDFNLGSVFYRDTKDEYLTRTSPLSPDIEQTINFVGNQNSNGGGDKPEAVEAALEETLKLTWREDALKIAFLILDAPPHEDDATMIKIRAQINEAARRGIKLIPITASGIGRETEFLMKFMAILTNGTYVFLTDDSGIGNPHLDPVVEDYEVEKLNDCLVRLIVQYSKSFSCDAQTETQEVEVKIYPNPSTQFINVSTNTVPDKIKIFSANGMMVKSITPTDKDTRIELGDFVNGIYSVSIVMGDIVETRQIILLK